MPKSRKTQISTRKNKSRSYSKKAGLSAYLRVSRKHSTIVIVSIFAIVGIFLLVRSRAATTSFRHPGILVSKEQLDFVKSKIAANQEPWISSYNKMKSNSLASKTYTPSPVPKLMCSTKVGLSEGFPQAGCDEMNRDSAAAYIQSLMYYFTGDVTYANNTAKILNAWTSTLKELPYDQPRTTNGEPAYWQNLLVVGWSTETMTRGAEIIRYTSSALTSTDISRAEGWYKNFIYPYLNSYTPDSNGNGGMSWTESLINIGIFTNDRAIYDKGIAWYRIKSPQLIYLTSDGTTPQMTTNANTGKVSWGTINQRWWGATSFVNGQETETCRDMGHTLMGLGPYANIAETVLIQGTHDLYAENKDRFLAGFELNAGYVNQMLDQMAATNQTATQVTNSTWKPTNFPCPDFKDGGGSAFIGTELAYNHFANRRGVSMPNTKRLIERTRPQIGGNHLFFETLTHANTANVGLVVAPPPATLASVSITGVTEGASVTSPLKIAATANNAPNFEYFEFRIDGALVNTERNAPYCLAGDAGGVCNNYTIGAGSHNVTATLYYDGGKTVSKKVNFTVPQPPTPTPAPAPVSDATPPSPPGNLTRSLRTDWGSFRYILDLKWTASQDNTGGTGVKEYQIRRNGQLVGRTGANVTTYADNTLSPDVTYSYTVTALDSAGNASLPSAFSTKATCFLIWCSLN